MIEKYDNFPKVVTRPGVKLDGPTAVHIDGVGDITDKRSPTYIYIWENETPDRLEQLEDVLDNLRSEYIHAMGIVYIEPLRELVPLEPEQITAYAWLSTVFSDYPYDVDGERLVRDLHTIQKNL